MTTPPPHPPPVPAEVQPLEIRSAASALTTAVRNGSSFVVTQFALPLLVSEGPRAGGAAARAGAGRAAAWAPIARAAARGTCTSAPAAGGPRNALLRASTPRPQPRPSPDAASSTATPNTPTLPQCATRWGLFAIFAACTAAGALLLLALVPETRGLPLEEVHLVWATHWLWGRAGCAAPAVADAGTSGGVEAAAGGEERC